MAETADPSSTASSSVSDSTPTDSTSKSSTQDDNTSSTSKTQDWESASASASASTGPGVGQNSSTTSTSKSSAPVPTGGGGSSGNWHAPHYVIYSDYWLHQMPDASDLTNFNRFILAFWMSERGAVDNAQMWEWMDAGSRQKVGFPLRCRSQTNVAGPGLVSCSRYRLDGFCFRFDRFTRF
jgi:hypothetical protein